MAKLPRKPRHPNQTVEVEPGAIHLQMRMRLPKRIDDSRRLRTSFLATPSDNHSG